MYNSSHHFVQDTSEYIALDRFTDLLFLLYTFDHRKIELQRTIQIGIDRTGRNGPVPSFMESLQPLHHFVRFPDLQSRGFRGRDIIDDQFVLQRLFIMVVQLMDKTADFACLQTITAGIVEQADMGSPDKSDDKNGKPTHCPDAHKWVGRNLFASYKG